MIWFHMTSVSQNLKYSILISTIFAINKRTLELRLNYKRDTRDTRSGLEKFYDIPGIVPYFVASENVLDELKARGILKLSEQCIDNERFKTCTLYFVGIFSFHLCLYLFQYPLA